MRKATVYTLGQEVVGYRGSFVEVHSHWFDRALPIYDASEPEAFVPMTETIERLPVYSLKNPHTGEELLVAMDQRIHVILTAAAEVQYREAIDTAQLRANRYQFESYGYERRISDFINAPWYRRVWRALRKEL